jgi:hypothetical protein
MESATIVGSSQTTASIIRGSETLFRVRAVGYESKAERRRACYQEVGNFEFAQIITAKVPGFHLKDNEALALKERLE